MKKFIIPVIAILIATTASANPRLKNKKHFAKDYDPNKKIEYPTTTLAALNKGPLYKNAGHEYAEVGQNVYLNNANDLKGPKYKNSRNYAAPTSTEAVENVQPDIAAK